MDKFSSTINSIGKVKYHDMNIFTGLADAVSQIKYPDMAKFVGLAYAASQIKYPDMTKFAGLADTVNQIKFPDMAKFAGLAYAASQIKYPDMTKLAGFADTVNQIKYPDMAKFAGLAYAASQIKYPDIEKFVPLVQSLSTYSNKTLEIDWENFEPTDEDIKLSRDILESENGEEILSKELSESKDPNKISKPIKSVILFIYQFMMFLAAVTQVTQYVENTVIPIVQSYTLQEQEDIFLSEKAAIKWLNDELNKDVSNQITKNFRIVVKNDLVVREGKTRDSRIAGKLNTAHVVQIVEKRKNWSYVIYSNYEDEQVIEGWVFTRYLRQIK